MKYYISLDVGGTFIKSGIVNSNGELIIESIGMYDSEADKSRDEILNNLLSIIEEQLGRSLNLIFHGIGIAFPGPFDYKNGISLIKGLNKYDSIYGINIKEYLLDNLKSKYSYKLSEQFDIRFENDASMFALGEYTIKKMKVSDRVFCLCIGTGAGSAYIENGDIRKEGLAVPKGGCIYHIPYKDGIIDDFISSRGIVSIAKKYNLANKTVKEISEMAKEGDEIARKVFSDFSLDLMQVIKIATYNFKPKIIILGGQISKSYFLFNQFLDEYCKEKGINVFMSEDTSLSTIIGTVRLFK